VISALAIDFGRITRSYHVGMQGSAPKIFRVAEQCPSTSVFRNGTLAHKAFGDRMMQWTTL